MGRDFHERLRQGFLDIAAKETERCCVIDASGPIDQIAVIIRELISQRFQVKLP
jgi:dTMP kinase